MIDVRCCKISCGVVFGMPDHVYEQARDKGTARKFYCPNGHEQWFTESEEDRQRRRADAAEAQSKRWRDNYDSERKSTIYWKGQAHRKPKAQGNGK